jgi:hypothetical protein
MSTLPKHANLHDRIATILKKSNLAGKSHIPQKEYENIAQIILDRLTREASSEERVKRIVQEELQRHFGVKPGRTDARLAALSRRLLYMFRAYKRMSSIREGDSRAGKLLEALEAEAQRITDNNHNQEEKYKRDTIG